MLTIEHLVKTYGKLTAVDNVSLKLSAGVLGLIGHNGAGKTSLLQMIATLSKPTSGQILFDGVDIVQSPDTIRRRLGFLPQDFGVYPNLTALEFLQHFAALKGVKSSTRIKECLEIVNLTEFANKQALTFSGGMKRRLGIAQVLLNNPDILIFDEPTAGLDPEERMRFKQLLMELGSNKLIIVSTHIVSDIESMAENLAIIEKGKLLRYASPETLITEARGKIWSAQVDQISYDLLRKQFKVLQALRQNKGFELRIANNESPCNGAVLVEPNLEEALATHNNFN